MLYKNLDEVYEHCPDDLKDVVDIMVGEMRWFHPVDPVFDHQYALFINFLNKKIDKEKLIKKHTKDRSHYILDFIKALPDEYIPDNHFDTINSFITIMNDWWADTRKNSMREDHDYMVDCDFNTSDYNNKFFLENEGLFSENYDAVPDWLE